MSLSPGVSRSIDAGEFLKYSSAGTAVWAADNDTVYVHPTTAGNKHIPTGGSAGDFLTYSSSGTAVWGAGGGATSAQGALADSAVQPADTFYIGTTQIAHNRSSAALELTGISIADGANDFDIKSHDGTNGLRLGGDLVTATAAQLNNTAQAATTGKSIAMAIVFG